MTPQEIIQAKVIAMQSAGPGGTIESIKERFEFLVADEVSAIVERRLELTDPIATAADL